MKPLICAVYNSTGSEGNNLKWFLKKRLFNFHSSKKTFLIKNSINNRVSQIHLLLYEQSDNDMFERKNCAKTNKQIAHNDI